MNKALSECSVAELAQGLREKVFSAVELTGHFLPLVQADDSGSFLEVNAEAALAQAKRADARLAARTAGPLEGVPLAHKDIFVTRGCHRRQDRKCSPATTARLMQLSLNSSAK